MQYAIHENFYPGVEKKLNRIARKCERLGNSFTYEVKGAEIRKHHNVAHKFVIIDVEGIAKVEGWEFIATLDIHPNGNIIRRYNTDVELPERFMTSDNKCDHCHTKRPRNNLYVIRNTDTGEFKQVGASCLNVYTNGLSLEYVAAWIDGITELEQSNGVFSEGGKRYYSIRDVIGYACIAIDKMGYIKANDYGISTKDIVITMLRRDTYADTLVKRIDILNKELKNNRYDVRFSAEDFSKDFSSEIDSIIEYYDSCDDGGEFIHNIKIMIDEEFIPWNYLGYVCYLPQGYAKHMKREAEKAERKKLSHIHFGEVGKRYKNIAIKSFSRVASYETAYGTMNVYNIVIDNDVVLTWKTCKYIDRDASTIDFTVKAHSEYKGCLQTEVTRCNVK